ncbi:MAG: GNAT family N-acetyltransferase [Armatimonadetes bacterium]|nr:GNAT family N-acetyltransferase [Armatimonadota bacterium]
MLDIVVAPEEMRDQLWQLFLEYADELSELDGEKRPHIKRHYDYFDQFWADHRRTPFAIIYDHELIGFCFLEDTGTSYKIREFYVRPLQRQRGFGKAAVEHVKEHCRAIGRHSVIAANVYVNNTSAIAFWQSTGFCDTGRRLRIGRLRLIEMECNL